MEESRRKRRSPPEGSHDTLATNSVSTGPRAAERDLDPPVALQAEIWMQPAPIATKTTVLTPGPLTSRDARVAASSRLRSMTAAAHERMAR
jgi:hypothetical protein